jgi:hypothetical protein
MQSLNFALNQAPFVKHKSLCPRNKLHDASGTGKFKFVAEPRQRHQGGIDDFLVIQFDPKLTVSPGPGDYDTNLYG